VIRSSSSIEKAKDLGPLQAALGAKGKGLHSKKNKSDSARADRTALRYSDKERLRSLVEDDKKRASRIKGQKNVQGHNQRRGSGRGMTLSENYTNSIFPVERSFEDNKNFLYCEVWGSTGGEPYAMDRPGVNGGGRKGVTSQKKKMDLKNNTNNNRKLSMGQGYQTQKNLFA